MAGACGWGPALGPGPRGCGGDRGTFVLRQRPAAGSISLRVGDEPEQSGDLSELIWQVPALISILSRTFRPLPGDLIFTGTPAGVGPLARGDRVTGGVEGVGTIEIEIV